MARPTGQGPTPRRSVRVPDDLWARAGQRADEADEDLSAAINRFLTAYAAGEDPTTPGGKK